MKKLYLIIITSAICTSVFAQNWSGSTPGNIYYQDGNIGLGHSSPTEILHIKTTDKPTIRIGYNATVENYVGSLGSVIFTKHYDLNEITKIYSYTDFSGDSYGSADLRIATARSGDLTDRFTIKSTGLIGIGTNQPEELMHLKAGSNEQPGKIPYIRLGHGLSAQDYDGELGGIVFGKHFDTREIAKIYASTNWSDDSYGSADLVIATSKNGDPMDRMIIKSNGNVGIGVTNPTQKLQVAGTVYSTEVKVELAAGQGPDYVFEPDYELRTLKETKEYISENKHLPEIPSAKEMEAEGIDLGDMNMKLLKKIEELTLYQIELLERLEKAEEKIQQLEDK